jgi:hypothetical protein
MRRVIPFALNYEIDQSGNVTKDGVKVPHGVKRSRLGVNCTSVRIDDEDFFIWRVLSDVFYNGKLILPRDANFLSWSPENTMILAKVSSNRIMGPEEIHAIWWHYQGPAKVTCAAMAEKSGLIRYTESDFRMIIKDILYCGIR